MYNLIKLGWGNIWLSDASVYRYEEIYKNVNVVIFSCLENICKLIRNIQNIQAGWQHLSSVISQASLKLCKSFFRFDANWPLALTECNKFGYFPAKSSSIPPLCVLKTFFAISCIFLTISHSLALKLVIKSYENPKVRTWMFEKIHKISVFVQGWWFHRRSLWGKGKRRQMA